MSWLSRFVNTFRADRIDRALDEELRFHVEERTRDLVKGGLDHRAAAAQATRELGRSLRHREDSHEIKLLPWLENAWLDLKYAIRSLRRAPLFALGTLAVLAIAVGLNTSLFTVFNALAFRPWPVLDPARVVTIFNLLPRGGRNGRTNGFSLTEYRYLRDHARSLSGVIAWRQGGARLGHEDAGQTTLFQYVSGNYFDVLGVPFVLGRGFAPDEDRLDESRPVAVLRHSFWKRRFGGDPDIVGRSIPLDGLPFTVIGVVAPEFTGTEPEQYQLWIPLAAVRLLKPEGTWARDLLEGPAHCCSAVAGRLAPGLSREQARAELDVLHRSFVASVDPQVWRRDTGTDGTAGVHLGGTALFSQTEDNWRESSGELTLMFGAATLVILLACANVGNLMLARALSRQREMRVRLSIGASRWRVIRQLLTGELTSLQLTPDLTVLGYTIVLGVTTCLLFGLAPALRATELHQTSRYRSIWTKRPVTLRGLLLATQIAASVILLIGASLLVRGVQRMRATDPGFRTDGVSVVSVSLPPRVYDDAARAHQFFAELLAAMRETPGLWPAAVTGNVPLSGAKSAGVIRRRSDEIGQLVEYQEVTSRYFEVLQIPLVAGRGFTDLDTGGPYILVNETLAREFWPGQNAVGQTLAGTPPQEVIGVVKDTHVSSLHQVEPSFYLPYEGRLAARLIVRAMDASSATELAALVSRLDAGATIQVRPLAWYVERWMAPARAGASVASAVALLALGLATIGVFGVFAYLIEERRREIGIRLAIGAGTRHVVTLVMGSAGFSVACGLVVGLVGTFFASRLLQAYLFGVSRFDGLAYAAVAALLGVAAMAASYVPVRRALGVDPVETIRCE
jgi:putative ABC transport system permease protein